ncbi:redox-sensitive transcriptional activator SoxR [Allorhizobium sp. BGMRC 0089]|uniref:redox-sensitive transcriptional activator SoxR n=1 Tax=Allorhizobium sonneratiae TaxID=2934936 RepID=UPI0020336D89|nr:redox-sensitive transcriptional activator SoxR [Allorhizobium sonneratiae]MCM2294505.1 redox-sensitive transcriptional activator SoxR [Allorhizobium sonneratiae]
MSAQNQQGLSVGEVAMRSGVAVSALHFYERKGLIASDRSSGNQRRYGRDVLRRVAIIRVAQTLGIPLKEVAALFSTLPQGRIADKEHWRAMATLWTEALDERIRVLNRLKTDLDGCIGCGCLSMRHCALFNPDDTVAAQGTGAVLLAQRRQKQGEGD